jgi:hypothetical protein
MDEDYLSRTKELRLQLDKAQREMAELLRSRHADLHRARQMMEEREGRAFKKFIVCLFFTYLTFLGFAFFALADAMM